MDINSLQEKVNTESAFITQVRDLAAERIVGQHGMVDRLLIGLLADGHLLLEGLPGLAKTLAISTVSDIFQASFSRIQFTPDLLPADVLGTMIYNPGSRDFEIKQGPIFANFVLADEINRSPAKVQSALLECMQERQVTIGKTTFRLDQPFLVMATQNPIDQEGTYTLPEAQMDRFLFKVLVDYPTREEELEIMRRHLHKTHAARLSSQLTTDTIIKAREIVDQIYMDEKIEQYILNLIFASRYPADFGLPKLAPLISNGGSPRATISIAKAARCHAFLQRRAYVIPEDVRSMVKDVMRHRIGLTYEAEAEGYGADDVLELLIEQVEIP